MTHYNALSSKFVYYVGLCNIFTFKQYDALKPFAH